MPHIFFADALFCMILTSMTFVSAVETKTPDSAGAAIARDEAAQWREKGIAALKESQTHPGEIVAAARAFAKAVECSERAGDTDQAVEANSFLFWCKKKMSLHDIEALNQSGETSTTAKLDAVDARAVPAQDAQSWLARAENFATANPNEHLLIAIRFFEIAGRFKGTDAGLAAMERSLSEMQRVLADAANKAPPPVEPTIGPRLTPPAEKPAPVPIVVENSARRGNKVNLLALVKPDIDVVSGSWHLKEAGGLSSEKSFAARIEFPYRPPQEYDFKIVFTCVAHPAQVNQILSGGGHSFSWIMGAEKGQYSAIETIAGNNASNNSTTIKQKQSLEPGRTYTSLVEVRKDRVRVLIDGRTVAELKTDFSDLGIVRNWKIRDESLLALGSHNTATVFQIAEVTEVSGKGTFTRP